MTPLPVVISIGGSVVVPNDYDVGYLRRFVRFVRIVARSRRVVVVVGGGSIARRAVASAVRLGLRNIAAQHWIPTEQPIAMREAIEAWCDAIEARYAS